MTSLAFGLRPRAAVPVALLTLVAVAVAVAALAGHPRLLAGAALAAGALALLLKQPRLAIPVVILALPLEISKLAFPFLESRRELGGGLGSTSIVDAGRVAIGLTALVWLLRPGRPRADVLPQSPLALPLALLIALHAVSILYAADVVAARTETLRLLFLAGFWALVPFFVRDLASLRWCLFAFIAVAAVLAVVGIYQQASGHFFWNPGLGLYGERRINATFADPNHFARYLVEALALVLAAWFFATPRERRWFLAPAAVLCTLTLIFTGSRGGWIVALLVLPALLAALPVPRRAKLRTAAGGALAGGVTLIILAILSPWFSHRLGTARFGFEALGARPYLVEAGGAMFKDHPIAGVGAGSYQQAFVDDYIRFKNPKIKANVTISHTSAVTIAAELGIAGLAATAFLAWRWLAFALRTARAARGPVRATVLGLLAVTAVVLLSSQTEGRLLEDPYLWLAIGLVEAVAAMHSRDSTPSPAEPPPAGPTADVSFPPT